VSVKGTENQEVYVTFSPQFQRIWLESKKRLPEYVSRKPANLKLRSQYSIRFYDWAKKYVEARTKTVSLEELRRVLGLESVKNAKGTVIHEAPMPIWANFRQRALDVAILEINAKTDLKIKLVSIERSKHRRVVALDFAIKTQAIPKGATRLK
jgi:plasmid replication initiation protein